jgi:hypothetical protein
MSLEASSEEMLLLIKTFEEHQVKYLIVGDLQ